MNVKQVCNKLCYKENRIHTKRKRRQGLTGEGKGDSFKEILPSSSGFGSDFEEQQMLGFDLFDAHEQRERLSL